MPFCPFERKGRMNKMGKIKILLNIDVLVFYNYTVVGLTTFI
jgi:hypothetical protein